MAAAPRGALNSRLPAWPNDETSSAPAAAKMRTSSAVEIRACPATFTARNNATYLVMIG